MRWSQFPARLDNRPLPVGRVFTRWRWWSTTLLVLASTVFAGSARATGRRVNAQDISVRAGVKTTEVVVEFTAVPTFTARYESQRHRLIVDVPNATLKEGVTSAINRTQGLVAGVLAQGFRQGRHSTVRLWITMTQPAAYSVRAHGTRLVVTVGAQAEASGNAKPVRSRPSLEDGGDPARVVDVDFDHQPRRDRLTLLLSTAVRHKRLRTKPGMTVLVLEDCRLPRELTKALDVSAFTGPLARVSVYPDPARRGTVRLEAEHSPTADSRITQEGTRLVWSFFEPGAQTWSTTGVAADGGPARRSRTVHVEDALQGIPEIHNGYDGGDSVIEQASVPANAAAFTPTLLSQQRRARFTGRRIDLDLKDADIHNVLRLLADVGQVNIVTADNVSGAVTIRMRNVPWDQALDVVLQAKKLGMVRQGNMIRVAPTSDLEQERELELARRKAEAKLAPLETRLIPVSYADAAELQARAKDLLSPRGSLAVDARTNVLVVRDVVGNLSQIEELTQSLDTQTPQVLVEARIVEATSRYMREIGIQWGGDATFSPATGNPTGLVFPSAVGMAGGASPGDTPTAGLSPFSNTVQNPNFAVNLPATVGAGQGGALGLTFGSINNNFNLNVRLSAAEATGMVRILSSPRVLTLDNQEARIAQGTLIPFSQVSAQGVQTTFQEAKLQLLVRPHVTADGSVSLRVKVNRDEPDFNQTSARGDPTILKREAETTLLVADGHTAVIGGVFTRNTGRNLDQVPFFGDIPILGLLFQHRRANDIRSELVIFLTPRIVNRSEAFGR
ncbi:type IV pilus secretin PilQ [Myxococcota bacterium]